MTNKLALSAPDEYLNHQLALPHQVVASSDPNWRERYWISLFDTHSKDTVLTLGVGKYPNRDVMDNYAILSRGGKQRNLRASRQLLPSNDQIYAGPFSIEIVEPFKTLKMRLDKNETDVEYDLTWHGSVPPALEGNHFEVSRGRVTHQISRYVQTGQVPAPHVHWFDGDGRWLERPAMIMAKASGTADRELLSARNKQGLDLAARVGIAKQMAVALAQIHRVDVAALALDRSASASNPALEQLEFYDAEILKTLVEPMPELTLASLWLREHLPEPPARATLVHGDYRPANILVVDGQLSAVLDWEFAHVGDPAEDIGWYLTSYYAHEHLIEGSWSADDFTAAYEQALGAKADRRAVRFWAVFCLYKLASMTMAAQFAFVNGDNSRMGSSPDFILRPLLENTLRDMTGLTTGDLR